MTRGVRGQRRQELPDSVHGIHDTDAGVGLNQKGRQVKELPEEQNSKGNPHNDPPEEDDVGVSSHPSPLASDPPSVAPTDEPVEAPTDVPVEAPVEAPTDVPVEVPVEVPSLSPVILTAPTGNDDQPPREEVRAEANYIVAVNNDVAGPYDYAKDLIFGMDELSQQVAQRDFPEMFTIRTPTTLLVVGPTACPGIVDITRFRCEDIRSYMDLDFASSAVARSSGSSSATSEQIIQSFQKKVRTAIQNLELQNVLDTLGEEPQVWIVSGATEPPFYARGSAIKDGTQTTKSNDDDFLTVTAIIGLLCGFAVLFCFLFFALLVYRKRRNDHESVVVDSTVEDWGFADAEKQKKSSPIGTHQSRDAVSEDDKWSVHSALEGSYLTDDGAGGSIASILRRPPSTVKEMEDAYATIDSAISTGDWMTVGTTAALLSSSPLDTTSTGGGSAIKPPKFKQALNPARAAELDRLVDIGDWEAVAMAASRYDAEDGSSGSYIRRNLTIDSNEDSEESGRDGLLGARSSMGSYHQIAAAYGMVRPKGIGHSHPENITIGRTLTTDSDLSRGTGTSDDERKSEGSNHRHQQLPAQTYGLTILGGPPHHQQQQPYPYDRRPSVGGSVFGGASVASSGEHSEAMQSLIASVDEIMSQRSEIQSQHSLDNSDGEDAATSSIGQGSIFSLPSVSREELWREIEQLIGEVVPEEFGNMDGLRRVFGGKEEALKQTLITMKQRTERQRNRLARRVPDNNGNNNSNRNHPNNDGRASGSNNGTAAAATPSNEQQQQQLQYRHRGGGFFQPDLL